MKTQTRAQEAVSRISNRVEADKGNSPTEPVKTAVSSKPDAESAPVLTSELIAQLRAAGSIDAGVSILSPRMTPKPKADQTYELNSGCKNPLPQKRGVCLKVITAAVQLDRRFKIADITTALPDVKSAAYWTRQLAKSGHLTEVTSA
jgi:hypothetical protein